MSEMIKDKVCVVTGAGQGLGRAFALGLAAAGAKVVVNDVGATLAGEGRDDGPAAKVVTEIEAAGGTAVAVVESVAEWDGAERIIGAALDAFGRVDGVVNNAGIVRDRMFFNMTEDEWRGVLDVNLSGAFYVARAAAPHFKEQGSGAYVNITSTSGLIGNNGQANYGAAKVGIVALSRTIATDMARYGVRSNCIAPFAWTRMTNSIPTDTPEQLARAEKMKKADGASVAPLAVYLLSDDAAGVTGQTFAVRANEIFLMSQPRPLRSLHDGDGWTPEAIAERAIPAMESDFYGLDRTADVFSWDPV
jgi:NAD(P)-dependent dehydrogenase (short-subunit alcohol dehydrogenase family)